GVHAALPEMRRHTPFSASEYTWPTPASKQGPSLGARDATLGSGHRTGPAVAAGQERACPTPWPARAERAYRFTIGFVTEARTTGMSASASGGLAFLRASAAAMCGASASALRASRSAAPALTSGSTS